MTTETDEGWKGLKGAKWAEAQPRMDVILAPFGRAVLDAAALPDEGVVVDVGCGCGATSLMAAHHSRALSVFGFDLSPDMLAVARTRAAAQGVSVDFTLHDAATADPGRLADRVISRFGVMFFDDPPRAFANIRRWLRPGGRLAMAVWNPLRENDWVMDPVRVLEQAGLSIELPPPSSREPGPFSLDDRDHTEQLLVAAGFEHVEQTDLTEPMRVAGTIDEVVQFHLERMYVHKALASVPEATKSAAVDNLRTQVTRVHDGDGVTLGASARLVCART